MLLLFNRQIPQKRSTECRSTVGPFPKAIFSMEFVIIASTPDSIRHRQLLLKCSHLKVRNTGHCPMWWSGVLVLDNVLMSDLLLRLVAVQGGWTGQNFTSCPKNKCSHVAIEAQFSFFFYLFHGFIPSIGLLVVSPKISKQFAAGIQRTEGLKECSPEESIFGCKLFSLYSCHLVISTGNSFASF